MSALCYYEVTFYESILFFSSSPHYSLREVRLSGLKRNLLLPTPVSDIEVTLSISDAMRVHKRSCTSLFRKKRPELESTVEVPVLSSSSTPGNGSITDV